MADHFVSKKILKHAYIEVGVAEPLGFYRMSIEEQLKDRRRELDLIVEQIKRHTDADTPIISIETEEVCAFCEYPKASAIHSDGEPACCEEQSDAYHETKDQTDG